MDSIITQLPPNSWQEFRDFRLKALKTDPKAFGGTYEQEQFFAESQWRDFIKNMWLARTHDKFVGMVGLLNNSDNSTQQDRQIISLWVDPEYRGKGIAKRLIIHLQKYARDNGINKLYLRVTVTQEPAIRLYQSLGFNNVDTLKKSIKQGDSIFDQYVMEWHA